MLKKALFSPAQPKRAVTRFSPGFILASRGVAAERGMKRLAALNIL